MEINRQSQTGGDNTQQIQAQTVYVANGISEQRVREICSEVATRAIADNSLEASNVAMQRIERFVDLLLPRMQRIEKDFASFAEPAFQVLLRKAQLTAACTEREDDYNLLSELLAHRINNKADIKKKASITKAVEIIDQIDDDSLCGMTLLHAMRTFTPLSGSVNQGLSVLNALYQKLKLYALPTDELWIDNLSVLGAATTIPFSSMGNYEDRLYNALDGYCCVGIKKDSPDYSTAIEILAQNKINVSVLVDNELLDGYVRIGIPQKANVDELHSTVTEIINGVIRTRSIPISETQKECMRKVLELYSKDHTQQELVKKAFADKIHSFPSLSQATNWWNSCKQNVILTSVGRAIAHTNAKSIDSTLPDLD